MQEVKVLEYTITFPCEIKDEDELGVAVNCHAWCSKLKSLWATGNHAADVKGGPVKYPFREITVRFELPDEKQKKAGYGAGKTLEEYHERCTAEFNDRMTAIQDRASGSLATILIHRIDAMRNEVKTARNYANNLDKLKANNSVVDGLIKAVERLAKENSQLKHHVRIMEIMVHTIYTALNNKQECNGSRLKPEWGGINLYGYMNEQTVSELDYHKEQLLSQDAEDALDTYAETF